MVSLAAELARKAGDTTPGPILMTTIVKWHQRSWGFPSIALFKRYFY
jgi:hypothetical protein